MSAYEVDWDAGTENAYERHLERVTPSTGLCARPWCDDAALPGGEFCPDCEGDVENLMAEAGAYPPDDPKHPMFYERMADFTDMDDRC